MKADICMPLLFTHGILDIRNCRVFVVERGFCPCDRGLPRDECIAFCRMIINYLFRMIDWCYCSLIRKLTIIIEFWGERGEDVFSFIHTFSVISLIITVWIISWITILPKAFHVLPLN